MQLSCLKARTFSSSFILICSTAWNTFLLSIRYLHPTNNNNESSLAKKAYSSFQSQFREYFLLKARTFLTLSYREALPYFCYSSAWTLL